MHSYESSQWRCLLYTVDHDTPNMMLMGLQKFEIDSVRNRQSHYSIHTQESYGCRREKRKHGQIMY